MSEQPIPHQNLHELPPIAPTERSEGARVVDQMYGTFQQIEAREPHPDDELLVGRLNPTDPEYATLRASGVSEADIARKYVTRQQLQQAGFFFINRIGGHEKNIMSEAIPDPEAPGQMLDFSHRALLTRGELQKLYDYQQNHPEKYGLQNHGVNEVRKDMLLFLRGATRPPQFPRGEYFIDASMPMEPASDFFETYEEEVQWKIVNSFWRDKAKEYSQKHPEARSFNALRGAQEEFVKTHCSDIYTWPEEQFLGLGDRQLRGYSVQSMAERQTKLRGNPSPFLESGLTFSGFPNLDISIYLSGPADMRSKNQYRLNMAVLHLAGGHADFPGLSEMGGTEDQIYMPTGTYVAKLFPKTDAERAEREAEMQALLQPSAANSVAEARSRVLAAAFEHQQNSQSTLRQLAQRLLRL